jgi:hypothetical protein
VPFKRHVAAVLFPLIGCPQGIDTCLPAAPAPATQALKADISSRRASAFAKRLLQLAQEAPPHFACGCLLLTSELLKVGRK